MTDDFEKESEYEYRKRKASQVFPLELFSTGNTDERVAGGMMCPICGNTLHIEETNVRSDKGTVVVRRGGVSLISLDEPDYLHLHHTGDLTFTMHCEGDSGDIHVFEWIFEDHSGVMNIRRITHPSFRTGASD